MTMNKPKRTDKVDQISNILNAVDPVEKNRLRYRMKLAAKIDDARRKRNLSKAQFAEVMNKRPSEITKWLSGTHNFTTDTLFEIQHSLDIELLDIDIEEKVTHTHLVVISDMSEKHWEISGFKESKKIAESLLGESYGGMIQCEKSNTEA